MTLSTTTTTTEINHIKKIPPDYKKVNHTRRSRGYNFEYGIVNAFNDHRSGDWHARRLGGSSTGLPDIMVTNNEKSILYVIECKSGESHLLYVPRDQIERCKEITDKILNIYEYRYYVLAFKFKGNRKKGTKLQYRIVCIHTPTTDIQLPPTLKGIGYDIIKDRLTLHHTNKLENRQIEIVYSIKSIGEFVNWK